MHFLLLSFIFIFGLVLGSFLNCLVWRLYQNETVWGRSHCPKCRQKISWYDNIPVISFFLLQGKCRHCQEKISWQYPLVELIVGVLFSLAYLKIFSAPGSLVLSADGLTIGSQQMLLLLQAWLAIAVMTAVLIYDARWYLISTNLIIGAAILFFCLDIALGINWLNLFWSLFIGIGFFLLQYLLTRGRGLGEGDIWLGGLLAIIFPQPSLLLTALFISYLIGGVTGLILLLEQKKGLKSKLPLGIFLALGAILTIFFGSELLGWYLGLLGA